MNGIRSKTSTSPPLQVPGQSQQRNIIYQHFEEFQPQNFQQSGYSQPSQHQYPVQQIGVQAPSYDIGKPGFSAPRMPSPGLGQQPQTNMYQQQTQPKPVQMRK
ncbi:uncharacterized protein LOC128548200 [Mercenaria mercenaria]|uniref:uncharacterized protein LOC128548200 n=1 Tax=Mercenaria mercenaria TaxID=6596 RepID=UPI00234E3905|nr:uncharacterized protein LOC128548200 [Mercenaria mercenaria]